MILEKIDQGRPVGGDHVAPHCPDDSLCRADRIERREQHPVFTGFELGGELRQGADEVDFAGVEHRRHIGEIGLDRREVAVFDAVLAEHPPHGGIAGRPDRVGRDAAAPYVFDRMNRSILEDDKVFAEIAGVAVRDHIRHYPLIEMRIGDRQRERARRIRGDLQIADRVGLNLRARAIETYRLQHIALPEVSEHAGLALAECLDQRRHVPRGDDPPDAYRQRLRASTGGEPHCQHQHCDRRHPPVHAHSYSVPSGAQFPAALLNVAWSRREGPG